MPLCISLFGLIFGVGLWNGPYGCMAVLKFVSKLACFTLLLSLHHNSACGSSLICDSMIWPGIDQADFHHLCALVGKHGSALNNHERVMATVTQHLQVLVNSVDHLSAQLQQL